MLMQDIKRDMAHNTEWRAADADAQTHLLAPNMARVFLPLIVPVLEDLGFALVRVRLSGGNNMAGGDNMADSDGQPVLQVMAERADGSLTIADCAAISRALSPVLDVADPIGGAYMLEVSSAGSNRPLTRAVDFENWVGYEAKLELLHAIDGQRRFRGVIESFTDGEVRLQISQNNNKDAQILGFDLALLAEAQLVTDTARLKQILKSGKNKAPKN